MKTVLTHLPKRKKDELKTIVRMIREEFDVEMIILFGSYARGDWVEELGPDEFHYTYQSDFDILVVADKKLANKHRKWDALEDRFMRSSVVQTPVTLNKACIFRKIHVHCHMFSLELIKWRGIVRIELTRTPSQSSCRWFCRPGGTPVPYPPINMHSDERQLSRN